MPPRLGLRSFFCGRFSRSRRQIIGFQTIATKVTYDRTYELKMSDQALSALRREVRAARLRLRRDTRHGLEAPRRVVQLSEIDLPPVVRRYRLAHAARPGPGGKGLGTCWDGQQAGSRHGLDQGIEASATETPVVAEPDLAERSNSDAPADEWPVESTEHQVQPEPDRPAVGLATPASVEISVGEHSGNVTLYLPKELSSWLTDHHDASGVSYPELVLNAISWATNADRLSEIFSPEGSAVLVNDIFGRAAVRSKPVSGSKGTDTRGIRIRKDHMKVIIGLARTWTADNRNAFFVGVLEAYRDRKIGRPAD